MKVRRALWKGLWCLGKWCTHTAKRDDFFRRAAAQPLQPLSLASIKNVQLSSKHLVLLAFFVQYVLCTFCTRSTQCTWLLLKIRAQNLISYIPLWKSFIACTWKLSISLNTSIKGNWNKCESSNVDHAYVELQMFLEPSYWWIVVHFRYFYMEKL